MRPWFGILELCGRAFHSITGHLRRRPAPALEDALRAAFAELDRELTAILDVRYSPAPGDV